MPLHVLGEMTLTCGWTTCNLKIVSQDVSARNLSFLAIRERAHKLALEPLGDGVRHERPVRDPLDYVSPDGIVTQEAM